MSMKVSELTLYQFEVYLLIFVQKTLPLCLRFYVRRSASTLFATLYRTELLMSLTGTLEDAKIGMNPQLHR